MRTLASEGTSGVACVTWNKREFVYRVDTEGSARTPGDSEFTAIDAAFSTWQVVSDLCSDYKFKRGDRILKPKVGKGTESANVITFRERNCRDVVPANDVCLADGSCSDAYACWDISSAVIGLTTVTYSTRTGIAVDADIELNAGSFLMTTISSPPCLEGREGPTCVAYDVQNTMTHEIGHAMGFDHVEDVKSTMYASAPLGETSKRIIDLGTQDGFCSTYPRGQPPLPCDEQAQLKRKIVAEGSACSSFGFANPFSFLLILLCLMRRRLY
jgi:Matrixin